MKLRGEKIFYKPNWLFNRLNNPRFKIEDTYKNELVSGLLAPDGVDDYVSFEDYPVFEGDVIISFYYYIPVPGGGGGQGFPIPYPIVFELPGFDGNGPIMAFSKGGDDILFLNLNNSILEVYSSLSNPSGNFGISILENYGDIVKIEIKKSKSNIEYLKVNGETKEKLSAASQMPDIPNKYIFRVSYDDPGSGGTLSTYGSIGLIWDILFEDYDGNKLNYYKGFPYGNTDIAWEDSIVRNNGTVHGSPSTIDIYWDKVRSWGILERFLDTLCIEMDNNVIPYLENIGNLYSANELRRIPKNDYYDFLIPLANMFTNPPDIYEDNEKYSQLIRYIVHILFRRGSKSALTLYFRLAGYNVDIVDSEPVVSKYDVGLLYDDDFLYDNITSYITDLSIELSDINSSNPNPPSASQLSLYEEAVRRFLLPINATLSEITYIS